MGDPAVLKLCYIMIICVQGAQKKLLEYDKKYQELEAIVERAKELTVNEDHVCRNFRKKYHFSADRLSENYPQGVGD